MIKPTQISAEDIKWIEEKVGSVHSIKILTSGLTNNCFKVKTQTGLFFVKKFNLSRLDKQAIQNEQQVRQWAESVNLSPLTFFYSQTLNLLIQRFEVAGDLASSNLAMDDKIQQVATCLARLHQQALQPHTKLTKQDLTHESSLLIARAQRSTADYKNLIQLCKKLDENSQLNCLCHGDMSFQNLLLGSENKIIDWEYARLAEVEYDLASSIVINQLTLAQQQSLIEKYQAAMANKRISIDKITDYQIVFTEINKLWHLSESD